MLNEERGGADPRLRWPLPTAGHRPLALAALRTARAGGGSCSLSPAGDAQMCSHVGSVRPPCTGLCQSPNSPPGLSLRFSPTWGLHGADGSFSPGKWRAAPGSTPSGYMTSGRSRSVHRETSAGSDGPCAARRPGTGSACGGSTTSEGLSDAMLVTGPRSAWAGEGAEGSRRQRALRV